MGQETPSDRTILTAGLAEFVAQRGDQAHADAIRADPEAYADRMAWAILAGRDINKAADDYVAARRANTLVADRSDLYKLAGWFLDQAEVIEQTCMVDVKLAEFFGNVRRGEPHGDLRDPDGGDAAPSWGHRTEWEKARALAQAYATSSNTEHRRLELVSSHLRGIARELTMAADYYEGFLAYLDRLLDDNTREPQVSAGTSDAAVR